MANTPRDKALRDVGLAALCRFIQQDREMVGDLAEAVAHALEEIDTILSGKENVSPPVAFAIPVTGWQTDDTVPGFPYYYDLSVSIILETDVVRVDVLPESTAAARAANFTNTQTRAGALRLRAKHIPATEIKAQYTIRPGAVPAPAEEQEE